LHPDALSAILAIGRFNAVSRFRRHRVSRIRRTTVGAKVVVWDGEPLEHALERLKQKIHYGNRWPVYLPKPTKRRQDYYMKPGELERRRDSLAKSRRRFHSENAHWLSEFSGKQKVLLRKPMEPSNTAA
jgi:hypothetical protein